MGTNNFHNKNASKVFSIMDIEDWFEMDMIKEDFKHQLEHLGYDYLDDPNYDGLRSFPATTLGIKSDGKMYGDAEVFITIKSIMRSGYYQGVNLDWELEVNIVNYELDNNFEWNGYNVESLLQDFMNNGMAKIHAPYVELFIQNTIEDMVGELEKLYKEMTQPLNKVGQFSNGNAVYEKA